MKIFNHYGNNWDEPRDRVPSFQGGYTGSNPVGGMQARSQSHRGIEAYTSSLGLARRDLVYTTVTPIRSEIASRPAPRGAVRSQAAETGRSIGAENLSHAFPPEGPSVIRLERW
jgi:hypothetical protein